MEPALSKKINKAQLKGDSHSVLVQWTNKNVNSDYLKRPYDKSEATGKTLDKFYYPTSSDSVITAERMS